MNINNLKKEYKNKDTFTYKKLCEILEVEYNSGGNKKKKQLEDWERYFEYEKNGTKIKILNIREKPLPDVEKVLRKSKYYNDLETIILYGLKENNGFLRLSKSKALIFTNMVNKNYFISANNEEAVSKMYGIDLDFLQAFRSMSSRKLKDIFDKNLKIMKNKALVIVNNVTIVCVKETVSTEIDEKGEKIYNVREIFRKATDEELKEIVKAEKEALNSLGYEDKSSCFLGKGWGMYSAIVNKKLSKYNIEFYYSAYEIISNKDIITRTITEREQETAKSSLNDNVSDSICKSKNKIINNKETREMLVDMLINENTDIDLMSNFLEIKETYDMIDFNAI